MRAELERAELRLINWHEVFPTVDVMEVRILLNPLRGVEVPNVGEEQIQHLFFQIKTRLDAFTSL